MRAVHSECSMSYIHTLYILNTYSLNLQNLHFAKFVRNMMLVKSAGAYNAGREIGLVHRVRKLLGLETESSVLPVHGSVLSLQAEINNVTKNLYVCRFIRLYLITSERTM